MSKLPSIGGSSGPPSLHKSNVPAPAPASAAQEPVIAASAKPTAANAQVTKLVPTPEELQKLVSDMQRKVNAVASDLQFSVDDESGKSIVKVMERSSKDVIWQFPSEEALHVTRELDRFQQGLLVNHLA